MPSSVRHLNDLDEQCVRLCEVNVTANGLSTRVEAVHARDCRALLCERVFDFVHLDPFGSVAPQLDAAHHLMRCRPHRLQHPSQADAP